jgi:hypothetical protein
MEEPVMKPWRYHDAARELGESLADIKMPEPVKAASRSTGALDRIASGDTAFKGMAASREAAAASAPEELQKNELKKKLQALLATKRDKVAARRAAVDDFIEKAKLANPSSPDVTLNAMTSGNGMPAEDKPAVTRREGVHQGPAANFLAAGLKALKSEKR